jgi:endonuclease VIII-like 1
MPELAEIKIMSDFINEKSKNKQYTKCYYVEKGNNPKDSNLIEDFNIVADSNGKELSLKLYNDKSDINLSVFMGMSGNWKYVPTSDFNSTKYIRLRLDTSDGNSLLLHGAYMGPKFRVGKFTGVSRGPDPTKQFDSFKKNILDNISKKNFDKPICEVLLDQKYFNGIGNYLRSTILYYLDVNPFEKGRDVINNNPTILDLCCEVPMKAYKFGGGQLKDWSNPFNMDSKKFEDWVFYKKGLSCKDGTGRTFWYDSKWKLNCPYKK